MKLNRVAAEDEDELRALLIHFVVNLFKQTFSNTPGFIPHRVARLEIDYIFDSDLWCRLFRGQRRGRRLVSSAAFVEFCLDQQMNFVEQLNRSQIIAEPDADSI